MNSKHATILTLLLMATACTTGASGPLAPAAGRFDGTYVGELDLLLALSPQSCPYSATGKAVMTVRGGNARVDVSQATYFSGRVGANGDLTLISGQGRLAFINGRIAGGIYTASGTGLCQYEVRLARQPGLRGAESLRVGHRHRDLA